MDPARYLGGHCLRNPAQFTAVPKPEEIASAPVRMEFPMGMLLWTAGPHSKCWLKSRGRFSLEVSIEH